MPRYTQSPSGLVYAEKQEPPKPIEVFARACRLHCDMISLLYAINIAGAELVSVGRANAVVGGAVTPGLCYVVTYRHHEAVDFEEKT